MRFLADKNISHRLCAFLNNAGYEAAHVDQFSLGAAEDVAILDFARSGEWVIVTSDTDFGTLLAAQRATDPSVILTREVKPARDTGPAASVAIADSGRSADPTASAVELGALRADSHRTRQNGETGPIPAPSG